MAEVTSTFELKRGDAAPDFGLPDGSGTPFTLGGIAAGKRATVVVFACNHCPFVVHLAAAIGRCAKDYAGKGVAFVAISANDVANYPQDAPGKMAAFARAHGWEFPYLYDESQETAKAYAAACTPDFYVFDGERKLAYAGQFDASRPGNGKPVTGADLRAALDAVLAGKAPEKGRPSSGCNIKWKAGNAPAYFG
jgi:peroxiredoxin